MNKLPIRYTYVIHPFSTLGIRFVFVQVEDFSDCFNSTSTYANVLDIFHTLAKTLYIV